MKNIYLQVQLYITTNVFTHGDPNRRPKVSIIVFYDDLKEGTGMRFIFSIGKMYEINGEYGFPIYAQRLQLKEPPRNTVVFTDED